MWIEDMLTRFIDGITRRVASRLDVGSLLMNGGTLARRVPTMASLVARGVIVEQSADRLVPVNPLDGIGNQCGNRDDFHVWKLLLGRQRDAVGNRDLVDRGTFQPRDSISTQHAVRCAHIYRLGTGTLGHIGCAGRRTGCRNHVVVDNGRLSIE
jgi:hypothetical protein